MRATLAAAFLATTALAGLAVQPALAQDKVIRATMHGDVRTLDPVWTTQTIASIHGNMIFDRLFASDYDLNPQPQMVQHGADLAGRKGGQNRQSLCCLDGTYNLFIVITEADQRAVPTLAQKF